MADEDVGVKDCFYRYILRTEIVCWNSKFIFNTVHYAPISYPAGVKMK